MDHGVYWFINTVASVCFREAHTWQCGYGESVRYCTRRGLMPWQCSSYVHDCKLAEQVVVVVSSSSSHAVNSSTLVDVDILNASASSAAQEHHRQLGISTRISTSAAFTVKHFRIRKWDWRCRCINRTQKQLRPDVNIVDGMQTCSDSKTKKHAIPYLTLSAGLVAAWEGTQRWGHNMGPMRKVDTT